jgi:hypothetical protein
METSSHLSHEPCIIRIIYDNMTNKAQLQQYHENKTIYGVCIGRLNSALLESASAFLIGNWKNDARVTLF